MCIRGSLLLMQPGITRQFYSESVVRTTSDGSVPELRRQPAAGGPFWLLQESGLFARRRGRPSGLRVLKDLLPVFSFLTELSPPV